MEAVNTIQANEPNIVGNIFDVSSESGEAT